MKPVPAVNKYDLHAQLGEVALTTSTVARETYELIETPVMQMVRHQLYELLRDNP